VIGEFRKAFTSFRVASWRRAPLVSCWPSLAEAGAATGLGAGSLPAAAASLVTEVKDKGKDKKVVVKKNV
jgi:hypothetical protein